MSVTDRLRQYYFSSKKFIVFLDEFYNYGVQREMQRYQIVSFLRAHDKPLCSCSRKVFETIATYIKCYRSAILQTENPSDSPGMYQEVY